MSCNQPPPGFCLGTQQQDSIRFCSYCCRLLWSDRISIILVCSYPGIQAVRKAVYSNPAVIAHYKTRGEDASAFEKFLMQALDF